jgi:hypothetical protein
MTLRASFAESLSSFTSSRHDNSDLSYCYCRTDKFRQVQVSYIAAGLQ